jgi:hypothetical protein
MRDVGDMDMQTPLETCVVGGILFRRFLDGSWDETRSIYFVVAAYRV